MQCCGVVSKEKVQHNFLHQVLVPFFKKKTFKKSQLVGHVCLQKEFVEEYLLQLLRCGNSDPKVQKYSLGIKIKNPTPSPQTA